MSNKMGMGDLSCLRLQCAALLMMLTHAMAAYAARLDPGTMKFYPLVLPPPLSTMWVTNQAASSSGNTVTPSPPVLLTNLSDNNPATLVTLSNSTGLFIDMGQTNVVDRVFLIGSNRHLNLWPNNYQTGTNPPLGLIVVSVGNSGPTMKQAATWTVPYDAGNPVDTEVDVRFSPVAGRYVRIELKTNVNWGFNYWPGYALTSQPSAPANLTWNVGELELYGFPGPLTNLNAVVCDSYTNPLGTVSSLQQPLQIAALDLSYYLGELSGSPHPIITSAQTNLYPGTIYRIEDLESLAPDYNTMMANIASGVLPTNPVVSAVGREVQFTGWPYRCVDWGVWQFLEDQGVRWVYPDGHGDSVPTGNGISFSMLPLNIKPSATSIYANWDCDSLEPWFCGELQSVRQGYLYPWRNRWNASFNAGPIGGAEIPTMPSPGGVVNSNYTEGFVGYPHNFNSVVPGRILNMFTNWWGWASTSPGSVVASESNPTFIFDDPTLISWVANKMTNIAAVNPLPCSYPLNIVHMHRAYNLLPLDASVYSQDPLTIASNGPVQFNYVPWVDEYGGPTYSGAYYSFVTAVANQIRQNGCTATVGALAYADVFAPPTNIAVFPTNVQVEVCLYGAPNLPMGASANAALKSALDGWHTRCSRLATYDYALLHTDSFQTNPVLPVPLVAGTVDRAQYLGSIGALDGGCQANPTSIQYNPWNFYAYPRIRWNTNQTAGQLESEFFNGYFREAAAPMLAYYQGLENYQVTNGINMYYRFYSYGITPGSFPLSVLAAMQANLQTAAQLATNWWVIDRVADMQAGFNWVITNAGLAGVSLTDTTPYPTIGSTTNPYTVGLTNLVAFVPAYVGANWASLQPGPSVYWLFTAAGQMQQTFYITTAGTYTVAISAKGVESGNIWPTMNVYFGPGSASVNVNTTTDSTYTFTFTIPANVWDFVVTFNNAASGGSRQLTIDNIQITRR
jgi:hypothetical protein